MIWVLGLGYVGFGSFGGFWEGLCFRLDFGGLALCGPGVQGPGFL